MEPKKQDNFPLISCLCVTEKRPKLLKRAIDCFNKQTYENKQLVILCKDNDLETSNFLKNIRLTNIKAVIIPSHPEKKLGFIRNLAVKYADGDYICQWDDDDWYHSNRISTQFQILKNEKKQGSVLTRMLLFDEVKNNTYISHRRDYWEGSLMCEKTLFLEKEYDNINRGEDTPLVEYLYNSNKLVQIENAANLYIYVYHENNTWDYNHFEEIYNCSKELPEFSNIIKELLDNFYSNADSSILFNKLWEAYIQYKI